MSFGIATVSSFPDPKLSSASNSPHQAIHAVDKIHRGTSDASVLYIPVCPVTESNARYVLTQKEAFLAGTPAPDFPGGVGESEHVDRPGQDAIPSDEARQAMGLAKIVEEDDSLTGGAKEAIRLANDILGYK